MIVARMDTNTRCDPAKVGNSIQKCKSVGNPVSSTESDDGCMHVSEHSHAISPTIISTQSLNP